MFDATSRTTYDHGIYFYEKDIIYDNHIYTGDIQIECTVDYLASGFGFLIFPDAGRDLEKQQYSYLIKLGTKSITVYKCYASRCEVIKTQSITLAPPLKALELTLKKENNKITLYSQLSKVCLMTFNLDAIVSQQSIGFYSEKNNRILNIKVYSKIPAEWLVNMKNTQGGRISFAPHTIYLENCTNNAEWLQEVSNLPAGKYYLNYHLDEGSDITAYVYPTSDSRIKDSDKNILDADHTFTVSNEGNYIIKFVGKRGVLSQVSLTNSRYGNYIATTDAPVVFEGSYIALNMFNIESFIIHFTFYANPSSLSHENYIISNLIETIDSFKLKENTSYYLCYRKEDQLVQLLDNHKNVLQQVKFEIALQFYLFKNLETCIDVFEITNHYNQTINLLSDYENLNHIPNTLLSPIIVTDLKGLPYDLSASYRVLPVQDDMIYYFTNYEREIFSPTSTLVLENEPKVSPYAIRVYGIPVNTKVNSKALYQGTLENPHDLRAYCEQYVLLDNAYYRYEGNKMLYVDATILPIYQQFVIDYLKKDSYAINYNFKTQCYEVDTTAEEYNILYNAANTYKTQSTTQKDNAFCYTDLTAYPKHYLVLEKEVRY